MAISEEERARLREQFDSEKSVFVDEEIGAFVFTRPKPLPWNRYFRGLSSDDKKRDKNGDMAQLCRDCLAYPITSDGKPDLAKLAALFEELPGVVLSIVGELSDLAGAGASHVGKL